MQLFMRRLLYIILLWQKRKKNFPSVALMDKVLYLHLIHRKLKYETFNRKAKIHNFCNAQQKNYSQKEIADATEKKQKSS